MNYDERIVQLQKEKAAAEQAARDAWNRQVRRAFWLGQVAPVLVFFAVILCLLVAGGVLK
jgi:hypothetical protein